MVLQTASSARATSIHEQAGIASLVIWPSRSLLALARPIAARRRTPWSRLVFRPRRDRGGSVAAAENVTVLFTDLVGSTELASALTPEAGDEVRRQHFLALRRAIAASGGTEVK